MKYSFYELLSFFFIYSFLGWSCEVIYAALKHGRFVNRGYLMGPVCPIYGMGVVAVLCVIAPIMDRVFLVYILSVVITSLLELLIGIGAEALLHERLWDYSDNPLNIGGYICLTFSLVWGVGCLGIIYWLHPLIYALVSRFPHTLGVIILSVFSAAICFDACITSFHALKIDRRMKAIDELSGAIEAVSDRIGENLSDRALRFKERAEKFEQSEKYLELVQRRNLVHEHLFSAFDHLREGKYSEAYSRIMEARAKMKDKKK